MYKDTTYRSKQKHRDSNSNIKQRRIQGKKCLMTQVPVTVSSAIKWRK